MPMPLAATTGRPPHPPIVLVRKCSAERAPVIRCSCDCFSRAGDCGHAWVARVAHAALRRMIHGLQSKFILIVEVR
jgi:hypothetical protein